MNEIELLELKTAMETSFRKLCMKAFKDAETFPEMMQGLVIMNAKNVFRKNMKEEYFVIKKNFENSNQFFELSEQDYNQIVDDITNNVLTEFGKEYSDEYNDELNAEYNAVFNKTPRRKGTGNLKELILNYLRKWRGK